MQMGYCRQPNVNQRGRNFKREKTDSIALETAIAKNKRTTYKIRPNRRSSAFRKDPNRTSLRSSVTEHRCFLFEFLPSLLLLFGVFP